MTTGTWPSLSSTDPGVSAATWSHQEVLRATWIRGLTKRGKPPRDHYARMLRAVRIMATCITLLVSLGWAALGAALLIW